MRNVKLGVLVGGLIAAVAWFVPYADATLFSYYLEVDPQTLIVVLAGELIAVSMAAMAMRTGLQRWQALVALVGLALFVAKFLANLSFFVEGPLALQLMLGGTILGAVSAIIGIAKPEPAR